MTLIGFVPPPEQVKVDSDEHSRKAGGRLRWAQLRRWLEKRAGGCEMLTLRCVSPSCTIFCQPP